MIEELGFDKNNKASSQPLIKSAPNKGLRLTEKKWKMDLHKHTQ